MSAIANWARTFRAFQTTKPNSKLSALTKKYDKADLETFTVAGKSGTAETGVHGKAHGWFTCYAAQPGKEASIAVCVLLEAQKPGDNFHGGGVCAPLARHVIETYFKGDAPPQKTIKEDKPVARRRRRQQ